MFDFLAIGPLTPEAARRAIEKPAQAEGVTVTGDALERILAQTRCYPYFLQEWGKLHSSSGAPADRTRQEACNAPRKTPADRASKQQSTTRRMEGCSASPAVTVRTAMPAARAIGKR